jgi:hypothetical protein
MIRLCDTNGRPPYNSAIRDQGNHADFPVAASGLNKGLQSTHRQRMAHNPGGRPRFPVKGRPMRERHHKSRTCQGTSNGRQGLSGYMH